MNYTINIVKKKQSLIVDWSIFHGTFNAICKSCE